MKRLLLPALVTVAVFGALLSGHARQAAPPAPLRLAIAGLAHGHVTGFLRAAPAVRTSISWASSIPTRRCWSSFAQRYSLADSVLFTDLAAMLDRAKPEAVAAFTDTFDHLAVVEAAASRGVRRHGREAARRLDGARPGDRAGRRPRARARHRELRDDLVS